MEHTDIKTVSWKAFLRRFCSLTLLIYTYTLYVGRNELSTDTPYTFLYYVWHLLCNMFSYQATDRNQPSQSILSAVFGFGSVKLLNSLNSVLFSDDWISCITTLRIQDWEFLVSQPLEYKIENHVCNQNQSYIIHSSN